MEEKRCPFCESKIMLTQMMKIAFLSAFNFKKSFRCQECRSEFFSDISHFPSLIWYIVLPICMALGVGVLVTLDILKMIDVSRWHVLLVLVIFPFAFCFIDVFRCVKFVSTRSKNKITAAWLLKGIALPLVIFGVLLFLWIIVLPFFAHKVSEEKTLANINQLRRGLLGFRRHCGYLPSASALYVAYQDLYNIQCKDVPSDLIEIFSRIPLDASGERFIYTPKGLSFRIMDKKGHVIATSYLEGFVLEENIQKSLQKEIDILVKEYRYKGSWLHLYKLSSIEWDHVYIYGPPPNAQHFKEKTGIDLHSELNLSVQANEEESFLIFLLNGRFAGYTTYNREKFDFLQYYVDDGYSRKDAKF